MLELDSRLGVMRRPDGLPDIAWCEVPAGPFVMGGDPDVEGVAWAGAPVDIPYPFWVAKYPVTYAQFAAFFEDDGYGDRRWWTDAGWEWKGWRWVPSYWDDARWHMSNHPVIGVSWYEAHAFTRWLDAKAPQRRNCCPNRCVDGKSDPTVR
jgi:formylglycine-generating enzyme required for sulfatase activity